jgi:predicted RNase H-like nuclease
MTSGCALTQGPREATSQQRVECGSSLALMDRIDPHKHPISPQKLLANLVGKVLVIDRGLGMYADGGKLLEDSVKAIVCGVAACRASASPRQRIAILYDFDSGLRPCMRHSSLGECAELGRVSDGVPAQPRSHLTGSSHG